MQRHWILGAGFGWNSLQGAGLLASLHLQPHFSVDGGVGMSLVGAKLGGRARYNLLQSDLTPFAAAGLIYSTGWAPGTLDVAGTELYARGVKGSLYGQAVVGGEWVSRLGFAVRLDVGWSFD